MGKVDKEALKRSIKNKKKAMGKIVLKGCDYSEEECKKECLCKLEKL